MKSLHRYILESLSSDKELKKLGFFKAVEGKEVWFEMTYKKHLIRVVQEEVGNDDWWLAKVESEYLLDADNKPMTFETPREAAEEAIDYINELNKK